MNTMHEEAPFRDLKIDDIRKLIDEGYEVVDVREDWEWNKGHLPGARHVVLNSILANPTGATFQVKGLARNKQVGKALNLLINALHEMAAI